MVALIASALVVPLAAPAQAAGTASAIDYTQLVNPFIGTQGDHGMDGPGAIAPFGLTTVTPTTTNGNHTGYEYTSDKLMGFTNITLDGVGGGGASGDILVVPTYQTYASRPSNSSYEKSIRKNGNDKVEAASAGYYQVGVTESNKNIDAQVTSTTRTGVHDYTFANAGQASLVVDLKFGKGGRKATDLKIGTSASGNTTISGSLTSRFYNSDYKFYYYAETTVPTSSVQTWNGATLGSAATQDGTDIGAILNFNATAGQHLGLRVTLSPVSAEQAKRDAAVEVVGKTFEGLRAATKADWNDRLGKVEVESTPTNDPTGDLKIQLYTHLYRLANTPLNATSTDGTYRGADGAIYKAEGYTHYDSWSLWDDFHKYAGVASVYPDVYRDIMQSLVDLYASVTASGSTNVGSLLQSVPTVRWERAPVVVADAVSKGVQLQGLEQAYPSLKAQTGSPASLTNLDSRSGGLLGYSYDAYGMSVIAKSLGKTADAAFFLEQAARWAKAFDKDALTNDSNAKAATGVAAGVDKVGMLIPRSSNSDTAGFNRQDPESWQAAGLYQGTLWQYNWYDAQDLGGMVDLMGGKKQAAKAVNYFFGNQAPDTCSRNLHLYANEISVHAPFLFNYVGQPSNTQDLTYRTVTEPVCTRYTADGSGSTPSKKMVYQNSPDGMLQTMDNDAGTMSGYFVSSALGLYPVMAGGDAFQISTPIFDKTTIRYPGGKSLVIEAPGVSKTNHYIQSATLNGQPLNRTWLTAAELSAGGVLHFTVGENASQWAADGVSEDSVNDHVSSSLYFPGKAVSTSTQVFTEAAVGDGSIDSTITVTSANSDFGGADGSDVTSKVSVAGVPAGLSLHAKKTGARTLELSLTGKATANLVDDSTDALTLAPGAELFTGAAPSTVDRALALKVRFTGFSLTPSTTAITAGANGTVNSTVNLTLNGGATFAGTTGSSLPASSITFPGLASGITAVVTKTGATTATLALAGTLSKPSLFTLLLADSALTGATSAQVTGAGTTALQPFSLTPASTTRAELQSLYDDVRWVKAGNYSTKSFAALETSRDTAKSVLIDGTSVEYVLSQSLVSLRNAVDGLRIVESAYRVLQAEDFDDWSAGQLKTESGGTGTNVGGTTTGSWLVYKNLNFSDSSLKSFMVAYSHSSSSASGSSKIEIRTGSATGPLVTSIALATTGGWANYTQVSHDFTSAELAKLAGTNDVYLVFVGSTDKQWVANLDFFQFKAAVAEVPEVPTSTTVQFESIQSGNGKLSDNPALAANVDYRNGVNGVDSSKDGLKTEDNNGGRTLSGTTNGAWVRYKDINLGARAANKLEVTYDAPSGKANAPKIEVYVDSMAGQPLVSANLATTGTSWGTYTTASITLPSTITGNHDLFFKFISGTPNDPQFYVGNFDKFSFIYVEDAAAAVPFDIVNLVPGLSTERSGVSIEGSPVQNFNDTHNAEWAKFTGVNFGPNGAQSLTVNYDKPSTRSVANTWIEIRLDSVTGPAAFSSPVLSFTGSGWGTYANPTFTVDPAVFIGTHDVFVVFRSDSTNTSGAPYVGNFRSFQFTDPTEAAPSSTQMKVEFESLRTGFGTLAAAGLVSGTDYLGGGLKTESANGGGALAGTENGNWVRYPNVNLGTNIAGAIELTYDAPDHRVKAGKIAVYSDSMSGDPIAVADLPTTGLTAWGTYRTISVPLNVDLTGKHTLYFKFLATPVTGATNAGNFDSFTLVYGKDKSALRDKIAQYSSIVDNAALYVVADYTVFERILTTAKDAAADIAATDAQIASAIRSLGLAAGQLEWKVTRQVADLITTAEKIRQDDVTATSWTALQSAITVAKALKASTSSHNDYTSAFAGLSSAYEGLVATYRTSLTAPSSSFNPGTMVSLIGAGFAPGEVVTFSWVALPALTESWTATAGNDGAVSTSVMVPRSAADGTYEVKAEGIVSATPATATVTVRKVKIVTETSILGVPVEVIEGDDVPVTVGVTAGATGNIELFDGDTSLGSKPLDAEGTATFAVPSLGVGDHVLTAIYRGDDWHLVSTSAPVTITVKARTKPPVVTKVTVSVPVLSKATQAYGSTTVKRAQITTTVTGATTGKVTFRSGKTTLGTASIARVGNVYQATLRLPGTLKVGSYKNLTAAVNSGGTTTVSVASAATFTVVKATTSKVKVSAKKFKKGSKPKVTVKVATLSSGQRATGKIKIYVGKKVVKTVKLTAKKNGKVTVTLPKKYVKAIKVKAKFTPASTKTVKAKTSKTIKVATKK